MGANKNQGSNWCKKKKRRAIYARDRYICFYCRMPVHMDMCDGIESLATLDHVNGKHKDNRVSNLVTCCYKCNSKKKRMNADDYVKKLQDEGFFPSPW